VGLGHCLSDLVSEMATTYLLAVQAPSYLIEPGRFATESAFAEHLKAIRKQLAPRFEHILLVGPSLTQSQYTSSGRQLAEVSLATDGISFLPIHTVDLSIPAFWVQARRIWQTLRIEVRNAAFIHTGPSGYVWQPYLAMLNINAWLQNKPTAFFIDIDFRKNSQRNYQLGEWGVKSYLINKFFHDLIRSAQVAAAVRTSTLVLLKSTSMVTAFGKDRPTVRFFLDAAHSDHLVIDEATLADRIGRQSRVVRKDPLRLVYFGRLVRYKGVDFMIEAIAKARSSDANVELTIIGDGDERANLIDLAASRGLASAVTFIPAQPYGPELFKLIDAADMAIATPRVEDTPRAALDAMARGLPLLAFDIEYFRSLHDLSGAVVLADWASTDSLARQLTMLCGDRNRLNDMSVRAVAFAHENTQNIWLERRIAWTFDALDRHTRAKGHAAGHRQTTSQT
jgi:glycosyltransferase involved in cell wall biosynthesis